MAFTTLPQIHTTVSNGPDTCHLEHHHNSPGGVDCPIQDQQPNTAKRKVQWYEALSNACSRTHHTAIMLKVSSRGFLCMKEFQQLYRQLWAKAKDRPSLSLTWPGTLQLACCNNIGVNTTGASVLCTYYFTVDSLPVVCCILPCLLVLLYFCFAFSLSVCLCMHVLSCLQYWVFL